MSDKSGTSSQVISLPKGGGAIKGIGETFQPNLFTGTGNYSIPIATSPGRSGFGPKLSLQYSTGNGNGPFGLGWQLSIPRITRKTEKGLPKYTDEDVFVMSGAEDLVPTTEAVPPRNGFTITRYRPRTEGLFARIEKWSKDGDVHWRATTKENVTSIYGRTSEARIADPKIEKARLSNPGLQSHVYEWLLQETFDAKGNHILYEYAKDDPNLDLNTIYEENRSYCQLYIRRVYYGNLPDPLVDDSGNAVLYPNGTQIGHERQGRRYAFEVVFDYGDWDVPTKDPHPDIGQQELFGPDPSNSAIDNAVAIRKDPFSSFRAGFEIRTLRLCRRVLMFHHFKELGGPTLVRSTDFEYENDPQINLSFLSEVRVKGYVRKGAIYESAEMPPVAFKYSEFRPHEQRYQSIEARGSNLPPWSLRDPNFALVDLFGDGLPDVLETVPGGYRYWRNLGSGRLEEAHPQHGLIPSVSPAQPGVAFGDIAGDGMADLLVEASPLAGFFEATPDGGWKTFKAFEKFPSISLSDPNIRMVDLTGDGRTDALMTADHHFLWFECLGEEGYGQAQIVERIHNLDEFPDVYFNDPSGRVRLVDMTGDGLNDIVLVHNGRIDYWPNLGYGEFGKRITMANAPHLELNFDPKRLFLVDLDGSGCADLIYVDFDRVHFWFNQSGNRWSHQQTIHGTPVVSDMDSIQFVDFYGTGTATLLWSYDYNFQPGGNYKALDFCGGVKPYLLTEMSNNMGATTKVSYAPSTKYFLEDEANGTPWVTKLPFPVQVVDKVEVIDHISKTKLVTTYKYHHGYYDGREREFRGFGRVDQFDTETFENFTGSSLHDGSDLFDNNKKAYHVPPIETRSWFHTGIYFDEDRPSASGAPFDYKELTKEFRKEFYGKDLQAFKLNDHEVDTRETPHEAYRALRGSVLRTEVYGRDGTDKAAHPYLVTENRYQVKLLQPKNGNNHAVYLTTKKESLSYHYERNPADPRVGHEITLKVDDFGNVTDSVSIGYPRRTVPAELSEQGELKILYTHSDFINKPSMPDFYYVGIPCQRRVYEVTGVTWVTGQPQLTEAGFNSALVTSVAPGSPGTDYLPYEQPGSGASLQKRIIEWTRTYFRKDAAAGEMDIDAARVPVRTLANRLALGDIESLGLPYESYQAAFTDHLLEHIYGRYSDSKLRVTASMMALDGGYHNEDGYWWSPSGQQSFNKDKFCLPEKSCDPFGNVSTTVYDKYCLLIESVSDPLHNKVEALNNYRVLQPYLITDPNGNRSAVRFDALGMVVMTFVMGKEGENEGDRFDDTLAEISVHDDPTTRLDYDLFAQPAFVKTEAREKHRDPSTRWQISYSYSDGFGREIQKKIQAEPGKVQVEDAAGNLSEVDTTPNVRWVGSGWTIFNNKGKPIQKYEPFFDNTHDFRFGKQVGVSSTLFYDPLERVVATVHPNHTYEKVVFDPSEQENWDSNDTVLLDPRTDTDIGGYVGAYFESYDARYRLDHGGSDPKTWYRERINDSSRPAEKKAAERTADHTKTPTVVHLDTLGRKFLTIVDNKAEKLSTRLKLDIEGNNLSITDPRGIQAFTHKFEIAGRKVSIDSKDAGLQHTLYDVTGKPIYAWDSNTNEIRTTYDALRRLIEVWVKPDGSGEHMVEKTIYGESITDPSLDKNHRGKVWKVYDGAGLVSNDEYDFKGNLKRIRRRLLSVPKDRVGWSQAASTTFNESYAQSLLEPGNGYAIQTEYDALNRVTKNIAPDGSIAVLAYNEANLLNGLVVLVRGDRRQVFVENIDYNEKGQRTSIVYGNKVQTVYEYDPDTFRLTRLTTARKYDTTPEIIQDLEYTYDPVGNISQIEDDAIPTIWHGQTQIDAVSDYTYDPVYRLILATGREHKAIGFNHSRDLTAFKQSRFLPLPPPMTDAQALQMYTEAYQYNRGGNLEKMSHYRGVATDPAMLSGMAALWTRNQFFEMDGSTPKSNRITFSRPSNNLPLPTSVPDFEHDPNGNLLKIDGNLHNLEWDFKNQLVEAELNTAGGKAYYQYDAAGQRVRKFIAKNGVTEEHIYLGGYEIYRKSNGSGTQLERHTLHVLDDKKRIALVETENPGRSNETTRVRYQLGNHLGSSVLEVDDSSNTSIISYEEYYPYGETSFIAGKDRQEVSAKRYRYSGKERDDETGLYYYGARYYAPWLGRWVSCDPAGTVDGPNVYVFTMNNPICFSDNKGMQANNAKPDPQTTTVVGPEIEGSILVQNHPRYSAYVNESGEAVITEGTWATKFLAAMTGSTDRGEAIRRVQVKKPGGEWESLTEETADHLEIGGLLRLKPASDPRELNMCLPDESQKEGSVTLCHRDFHPQNIFEARHCFVWYHSRDDKMTPRAINPRNTSTYDPHVAGPADAAPNMIGESVEYQVKMPFGADYPPFRLSTPGTVCTATYNVDPECVKRMYQEGCAYVEFDLKRFNCCSCAHAALTSCGAIPLPSDFPEINQGMGLPESYGTGWKQKYFPEGLVREGINKYVENPIPKRTQ
ncbi:MAG: VCBS repeat-containing protein [Deltaproteobacteria bacterium]|nr:VCBS repeat-containing protein [Deltaproteobacteria bacterium]